MKNRLILISLVILNCGIAHTEGWFTNQWSKVRNYTPYEQGSFKTYPLKNVASRLASMRYLYGDDVAQDQEQFITDYENYLRDKYERQRQKVAYLDRALLATNLLQTRTYPNPKAVFDHDAAKCLKKLRYKYWDKQTSMMFNDKDLRPIVREQESEMLRPRTFYEYQHPNQYILNN